MEILKRFGIELKKDNFQEAAIYGIACAYALMEKQISDYLRSFNLTPAKFNAMMIIKHIGKDKGLSQVQIGRHLIVTASNMTRLLDKLNKEGYIERFGLKGDRRVNLVRITKKGSEILDKVWPGYYKKILEIADLLGREDLKQIASIMVKWCNRLGEK